MYRGRRWTMRQYSGLGTAAQTNERYRFLLAQGATGLSVALDQNADADRLRLGRPRRRGGGRACRRRDRHARRHGGDSSTASRSARSRRRSRSTSTPRDPARHVRRRGRKSRACPHEHRSAARSRTTSSRRARLPGHLDLPSRAFSATHRRHDRVLSRARYRASTRSRSPAPTSVMRARRRCRSSPSRYAARSTYITSAAAPAGSLVDEVEPPAQCFFFYHAHRLLRGGGEVPGGAGGCGRASCAIASAPLPTGPCMFRVGCV